LSAPPINSPTQQALEVFAQLSARLDVLLADFQRVVDVDLAEVNRQLHALEVQIIEST
jgi:hypothetical protein